jgi:signal transduction histidine kinase
MTFPSDDPRILPMAPTHGTATESLADIVASIRDAVLAERRGRGMPVCRVTLDVSRHHAAGTSAALLRGILAPLLARAIDEAARTSAEKAHRSARRSDAPDLHEVVVTSIESADAIEIEVADSGPGLPRGRDGDVEPAIQSLLEQVGGTLSAKNCPEGGTAFTVRLPHRRRRRMAA